MVVMARAADTTSVVHRWNFFGGSSVTTSSMQLVGNSGNLILLKNCIHFFSEKMHVKQKKTFFFCLFFQGHCGGLGEIDDTYSNFFPLEVKRNDVPPYYGTGRAANIPGYTGNIWWLGLLPAHKYKPEKSQTTTFNIHSKKQTVAKSAPPSDYARREKLMKLVTTVPPHNPFR